MKYNNILIIGKGRSLENVNKIDKKFDLVIICNPLWNSETHKYEKEYYKHPEIYTFLKKNKSTLVIRRPSTKNILASAEKFIKEFEIVDKFVTHFPISLKKKYEKEQKGKITHKSRFIEKKKLNNLKKLNNFDVFPEIVYPAVLSEIKLIQSNTETYYWLDTIGWCIDLAILYYQAKNVYFCGIDMYEEGYVYQHLFKWNVKPEIIEGKKYTFLIKLKNYDKINFEIYSYNKFKDMTIPENCKLFNF